MNKIDFFESLKKIELPVAFVYYASNVLDIISGVLVRTRVFLVFLLSTFPSETIILVCLLLFGSYLLVNYRKGLLAKRKENATKKAIYIQIINGKTTTTISKKHKIPAKKVSLMRKDLLKKLNRY